MFAFEMDEGQLKLITLTLLLEMDFWILFLNRLFKRFIMLGSYIYMSLLNYILKKLIANACRIGKGTMIDCLRKFTILILCAGSYQHWQRV